MSTSTKTAGAVVLLTRLARVVYRSVDEEKLGMRLKGFAVLNYVGDLGGATQRELTDVMGLDANSIVLLLNDLEARGYAVRERDPEDRRRHIVRVTPAGRKAVVRAEAALESVTDQALGALDNGERDQLRELLAKALGDRALASSS
ncbi:MAG TPA: MarR family winged helix-turn-helix transcriptional regulator [Solirubrobacteraceae bacterium]